MITVISQNQLYGFKVPRNVFDMIVSHHQYIVTYLLVTYLSNK